MEASRHYLLRAWERFGLSESAAVRLMELGLLRGKQADQFESTEKTYLRSKIRSEGSVPVVYRSMVIIYTADLTNCITVYKTPDWFGKKRFYAGKKQIRDAKKYQKYSMEGLQHEF